MTLDHGSSCLPQRMDTAFSDLLMVHAPQHEEVCLCATTIDAKYTECGQ